MTGEKLMCALLLRFREDVFCFAPILLKSSAQKPCKGVAGFLLGRWDPEKLLRLVLELCCDFAGLLLVSFF